MSRAAPRRRRVAQVLRARGTLKMTRHLKYLGTSWKNLHDFRRFRPLRVILIPRCENNRSVAIENISRRNRQLPAVIAVGERQIDERSPVYRLLRRGHAVGQS